MRFLDVPKIKIYFTHTGSNSLQKKPFFWPSCTCNNILRDGWGMGVGGGRVHRKILFS